MPNALTDAEFRERIATMRELGVLESDGIVLGPPPPKVVAITAELERAGADEKPRLTLELEAELKAQRIAARRQSVRDMVGADLTDSQCDKLIGPEELQ